MHHNSIITRTSECLIFKTRSYELFLHGYLKSRKDEWNILMQKSMKVISSEVLTLNLEIQILITIQSAPRDQGMQIKATFSFHKLIPKNAQMTTLYTNWLLYITFTMIYYIRQE